MTGSGIGEAVRSWFAGRYPLVFRLATTYRWSFLAGLVLVMAFAVGVEYLRLIANARDLVIGFGNLVGGDYAIFRQAAILAADGTPAAAYDAPAFVRILEQAFPKAGPMGVTWQYPPTMFFLIAPLAWLPFLWGYVLWEAMLLVPFAASVVALETKGRDLVFVFASPVVVHAVITGQTGMLTGGLLLLGALYASSAPWIAGIAIGLLTMKPQFGVLIPVALLASRSWRTIAIATGTALVLAALSVSSYGSENWVAFIDAVRGHGGRMQTGVFPVAKLVTPFGAARMLGLGSEAALIGQAACSLLLAAYVYRVWRRVPDRDARAAVLVAAAPLATPYAFFYETAILVLPALLLVRLARRDGWLPLEPLCLAVVWVTAFFMPGPEQVPGLSLSFLLVAIVFGLVCRRVQHMVAGNGRSIAPSGGVNTAELAPTPMP